jgi:hypothetical protein
MQYFPVDVHKSPFLQMKKFVELQVAKSQVYADVLGDEKLTKQIPGMCKMTLRTIAKLFRGYV